MFEIKHTLFHKSHHDSEPLMCRNYPSQRIRSNAASGNKSIDVWNAGQSCAMAWKRLWEIYSERVLWKLEREEIWHDADDWKSFALQNQTAQICCSNVSHAHHSSAYQCVWWEWTLFDGCAGTNMFPPEALVTFTKINYLNFFFILKISFFFLFSNLIYKSFKVRIWSFVNN